GISHRTDPPDSTLELTERRSDLDPEVLDQPTAHAELVHALGPHHRRREREPSLRRLLAEEGEPEPANSRAERIAVPAMPGEARGPALVLERAQRLAKAVHHRGRRGVVIEARRAPVVGELSEIEIVAHDFARPATDGVLRARVVRDGREAGWTRQALQIGRASCRERGEVSG